VWYRVLGDSMLETKKGETQETVNDSERAWSRLIERDVVIEERRTKAAKESGRWLPGAM
jgi:hypothetical protein